MPHHRVAAVVAVSLSLVTGCAVESTEPGTETSVSEAAIDRAVTERAHWGLAADREVVADLLRSGADVGTKEFGIVMTAAESKALDVYGRMEFASHVKTNAVPYIDALPTSGGVYIDQQHGGGLVVLVTERNVDVEREIVARMPATDLGVRFAEVDHTEAELRDRLEHARDIWKELLAGIRLEKVGLDIIENRVLFEVAERDVATAQTEIAALRAKMGVRVAIAPNAHPDDRDVSCTSRDHCVSPTEAGTRIYKSYVDNYNECTMAFHVPLISGDVQFVTAGHCGYGGSNTWLIKDGTSNGMVIGTEQASLYHDGGQDILRISLPASQKSHHMYGDSRVYGGSGACPITGQAACASRGHSDVVDCGTVRTTWTSWYSNTANPDIVVWGGDMNDVSAIPGDSGSPIFDKLTSTLWGTVGVLDTSSAGFAVLCKAASGLDLTGRAY